MTRDEWPNSEGFILWIPNTAANSSQFAFRYGSFTFIYIHLLRQVTPAVKNIANINHI